MCPDTFMVNLLRNGVEGLGAALRETWRFGPAEAAAHEGGGTSCRSRWQCAVRACLSKNTSY